MMLKSYFVVAIRNIFKGKGHMFINICGLAIGLAVFMIISKYVYDELRYDQFHENPETLYRIGLKGDLGSFAFETATSGGPAGWSLQNDFPEVINACRLRMIANPPLFSVGQKAFYQDKVFFADSTFFQLFTANFIAGDGASALQAPHSLVLTQSTATKYFGNENPIGKEITWGQNETFTITAVVADPPEFTHLKYQALASFSSLKTRENYEGFYNSWFTFTIHNYFRISKAADINALQKKLPDFLQTYMGEGIAQYGGEFEFFFQPVTDIHLHSNLKHEFAPGGDVNKVYIFSGIAVLILLIAGINFINLYNASSIKRIQEICMRKILGAERRMLIIQFLLESSLVCLLAILLAAFLVTIFLPTFNSIVGAQIIFTDFPVKYMILLVTGLFIVIALLTGVYPALLLSGFQPLQALKGHSGIFTNQKLQKNLLVGFQFAVSIAMICTSLLVLKQLNYIKGIDSGLAAGNMLIVPLTNQELQNDYQILKEQLSQSSGVLHITSSSNYPGKFTRRSGFLPEGLSEKKSTLINNIRVDENFVQVMGLDIVTGENILGHTGEARSDILINQTLQEKLGWQDPIGRTLEDGRGEKLNVIGVVKDFHFASFHKTIEPLIIRFNPAGQNFMFIKISSEDVAGTIHTLQNRWNSITVNFPFEYFFMDETIDNLYNTDVQTSKMVSYFTILAIFIAALGLFALTQFSVERRLKEIGIRKILGASLPQIILLISKEFTGQVLAANLVAWPLAYWAMDRWLQNFAYRIDIDLGSFIIAGAAALLIAFITVSYQAVKAAISDPVKALRYE